MTSLRRIARARDDSCCFGGTEASPGWQNRGENARRDGDEISVGAVRLPPVGQTKR
jgi:hypothetical protein